MYWYGIAYLISFIFVRYILRLYSYKIGVVIENLHIKILIDFFVIFILVSSRLGYFILYQKHTLLTQPLEIFKLWKGGMSSHGGILGVYLAIKLFRKKHNRLSVFNLIYVFILFIPAGLFFGRLSNLINGELLGVISDQMLSIIVIKKSKSGLPINLLAPRHMTQIYNTFTEGLLLAFYTNSHFFLKKQYKLKRITVGFFVIYISSRLILDVFKEYEYSPLIRLHNGSLYSTFIAVAILVKCIWS